MQGGAAVGWYLARERSFLVWLAAVGFVVVTLVVLPAAALAAFPEPQGRVNDFAAVLDESAKSELASIIRAAETASSAEIAVVTVVTLDGMSVEEYANKLFAAWGIGKKGVDNGVLILVAPQERKMRIEVGYGLEPVLPDSLAGSIIRSEFTPAFKGGDYRTGILKGVGRVAGIVRENHRLTLEEKRAIEKAAAEGEGRPPALLMTLFFGVFIALGSVALGAGIRSRSTFPIVWGAGFGGIPFLMALIPFFNAKLWVLGPLAILLGAVGYLKGGKMRVELPARRRGSAAGSGGSSATDSSSSSDWSSSSSDSSSSSSSSDFGGGSSGGGGASGSW